MKKSDLIALMLLITVLCGVGAYYFGYRSNKPKMDTLDNEIAELQARYDDLKAKEAKRDWYIEETKRLKDEFFEELKNYPADLNQETTVMFLKGTETLYDTFKNLSVSLPHESTFYTIGAVPESTGGEISVSENTAPATEPYVATRIEYPIVYQGSYDQLKDYLDYIATYKYRMNISGITMAYNADEELVAGTINLDAYAVNGPDRIPEQPEVNQPLGVDNIFLGGEGAYVNDTSVYAADGGQAIVANHNAVILLNNASNDAASGVIIATDESSEKTFVTSEDNSVAEATFKIYEDGGKNFVDYSIGSKSYTSEILTSDFTVYVKSSSRVDSDDKNGISVKVDNTTGIPVYFKVADDDTSSPRFKLAGKTGRVEVY